VSEKQHHFGGAPLSFAFYITSLPPAFTLFGLFSFLFHVSVGRWLSRHVLLRCFSLFPTGHFDRFLGSSGFHFSPAFFSFLDLQEYGCGGAFFPAALLPSFSSSSSPFPRFPPPVRSRTEGGFFGRPFFAPRGDFLFSGSVPQFPLRDLFRCRFCSCRPPSVLLFLAPDLVLPFISPGNIPCCIAQFAVFWQVLPSSSTFPRLL